MGKNKGKKSRKLLQDHSEKQDRGNLKEAGGGGDRQEARKEKRAQCMTYINRHGLELSATLGNVGAFSVMTKGSVLLYPLISVNSEGLQLAHRIQIE